MMTDPTHIKLVFDAIPFGIMIIGMDKKIRMANSGALAILGYDTEHELIGKKCTDLVCIRKDGLCPVIDLHEEMEKAERILIHKDGREIPVLKTATSIHLGEEQVLIETFIDITLRRKTIHELVESQRVLNTLMGNLPGMVYRCKNDNDWTMEFISNGCLELTGYAPEQLLYNKELSYNDIILASDAKRVRDELLPKLATREPYTLEYRITTREGKIKSVWEKGQGVYNEQHELLFLEGFISDISESRESLHAQKMIYEISKSAYLAKNLEDFFNSIHQFLGSIINAENFYVAMYDSKNDTISLPYHVDYRDKFASFPAGKTLTGFVIRTKQPLLANELVIEDLALSGQIEIVGTPSKVWLGVPLIIDGEVIGVIAVQDYNNPDQYTVRELELMKFVADQIAILISRKTTEESFQQEQAYLEQLFEGSPEAIAMIDSNGIVSKINSEFTNLFGYTQAEIAGNQIDHFISTPETQDELLTITRNALEGNIIDIETSRKHKDGHLVDVSVLVNPIRIKDKIIGCYGIYRDISDRKKIEKNLIAAKVKAEESDKLKSAFLSNMSHEIRTPMNAILGFSTLLSDSSVSEEERLEFIRIIRDRGKDLMRIIDDIIDVAKIESGQIKVEIKECPVNVLLTNLLVTLTEVKRKQAKTHLILNCLPGNSDKDFSILTDGNRLRQVLTNLIENAIKFTDQGKVEFGYTLKSIGNDPVIEFFVTDTGIGIREEMQDMIFERFRQVDDTNTRKYGGTGLGLTISKNLIQLLGGEISLESVKGKGTSFFVRLPMQVTASKPAEVAVKQKIHESGMPDWSSKQILVAEDEESNYFLLSRILKKTGVNLLWARNGIEAIDLFKANQVDLVLMDIRMPVMDGYEATNAIKNINKNLPVIAQTAYALKGEREKSLTAGCDNYISKPIDSRELIAVLGKYLNK
jgi:PAS domain S-box-containing protein